MYTVFYSLEIHDRHSGCRASCTIASIAVTFSYVGTRMYNNNFTDISRCEGFYIVTVKLFYFKLCLSLKLHEKTWLFHTSIMLCRMHTCSNEKQKHNGLQPAIASTSQGLQTESCRFYDLPCMFRSFLLFIANRRLPHHRLKNALSRIYTLAFRNVAWIDCGKY